MVFQPFLVINRVSILAILVLNRAWFLHCSLELRMLFQRKLTYFFLSSSILKTINKSPSQIMFMGTASGHKKGIKCLVRL